MLREKEQQLANSEKEKLDMTNGYAQHLALLRQENADLKEQQNRAIQQQQWLRKVFQLGFLLAMIHLSRIPGFK